MTKYLSIVCDKVAVHNVEVSVEFSAKFHWCVSLMYFIDGWITCMTKTHDKNALFPSLTKMTNFFFCLKPTFLTCLKNPCHFDSCFWFHLAFICQAWTDYSWLLWTHSTRNLFWWTKIFIFQVNRFIPFEITACHLTNKWLFHLISHMRVYNLWLARGHSIVQYPDHFAAMEILVGFVFKLGQ